MKRQNRNFYGVLAVIFLGMTVLNFLCPYVADDYNYLLHFGTKERLKSLQDVAESMYIHCFRMNGRVVSHTIVQLFGLFPKWVYNVCNGGMFTLLVWLMYRVANFGRKPSWLLACCIAMGLWICIPAFGQVCLWYTGAVNYMWSLVWLLVFWLPYLLRFLDRQIRWKKWQMALFCLGSWLFGMYSEIASFVGIYLAAAVILVPGLMKNKSFKTWLWIPWLLACAGYVMMLCMPAQLPAKQAGSMDLATLLANFSRATDMLTKYCIPLLVLWCVSFVLGLTYRIGQERLILGVLMLLGAIGANYMTMVASYYPERCLCVSVMLLILSICMMLSGFSTRTCFRAAAATLAVVFALCLFPGVGDIVSCWQASCRREMLIESCKAEGRLDVTAEIIVPQTQYSVFWDLRDLSTDDPTTWPNFAMGKYYGLDSIIGVMPEE